MDLAIQDDKAHFEMDGMTAELIERKWHEAYRRFYMRPRRLVKRLFMKDTWRNAPSRLRDFKRFFFSRGAKATIEKRGTPVAVKSQVSGPAARRLG